MSESMTVLLIQPESYPKEITMDTGLEALQAAVGGYIEVVYPFDDPVGLVVNEEGKINGLPLNRALRDEGGAIYDVIAGDFLVVGLTEDSFVSLTPEQLEKYEQHFHQPETFMKMGRSIMALPLPDEMTRENRPKLDQELADRVKHAVDRGESR